MAQPSATTANGNSAARLLELLQMRLIAEAIYVVAALGIPDLLAPAPKSSEQLAEITGVNAPYLHRVMRALSSFGIFREEGASGFALASMGELLQRNVDGSLHSAAMLYGGVGGAQMLRSSCNVSPEGKAPPRSGSATGPIGFRAILSCSDTSTQ
jgi:hypothetical protein